MKGRIQQVTIRSDGLSLLGVSLGFFVVLFDATAVNVASGPIGGALDASLVVVQWVLNAYTVTFAALMLSAGSLGDRWGSRRCYVTGCAVFAVASAACAAAPSAAVLIAARAVQGAGAAAVVPCSLALIADRFPGGPRRSRALGVWGGVAGIGLAAGPVIGGVVVAAFGWRAVFFVVVPLAAGSIAVVTTCLPETSHRPASRVDVPGQILVIAALVALTAALAQVSTVGWVAPRVVVLFGIAAVAGVAFVVVEHRVAEPIVPFALLRSSRLSGALGIGLLFNFGLYGSLFSLALVLERGLHQSSAIAGLALIPLTVATALGALLSGRLIARFGPRTPICIGLSGGLLGACLLAGVGRGSSAWEIAVFGAVLGLVGFAMPAMTAIALEAVEAQRAGLAAALLNAARQAGGAIGVALLGTLTLAHTARHTAPVEPHLAVPMLVAAGGYLTALTLTATALEQSQDNRAPPHAATPQESGDA